MLALSSTALELSALTLLHPSAASFTSHGGREGGGRDPRSITLGVRGGINIMKTKDSGQRSEIWPVAERGREREGGRMINSHAGRESRFPVARDNVLS